jgi:hypothetical protein
MNRLAFFSLGLLVGAAVMFTSLKYHVVRAEDGFHLIPKLSSDFSEVYVDIRQFNLTDWDNHRSLAVAIVQAEKGYLLKGAASETLQRSAHSVLDMLHRSPKKGLDAGTLPDAQTGQRLWERR